MSPPFSAEQFFQVFVAYNEGVWPAQILLVAAAVACLFLAFSSKRWAGKTLASILAALWVWMAVAYHWAFFVEINPPARVFGAFFLLEAVVLLWVGLRAHSLRMEPRRDLFGIAGGLLILYALVLYPLIGIALGHRYPAQPTFGLPCPTTIFTVGILVWAKPKVPWGPLIVPLIWSVVGMTAVAYFGVLEDTMLPVATISATVLILMKNQRAEGSGQMSADGGVPG